MVTPSQADTVVLFLPSLEGGGAERVFVELANQFSRLGLQVDLALACARGPYLAELSSTVRVVELGGGGVMRSLPGLVRYLRRQRPAAMLSALDHANITAILACSISRSRTRCVISVRAVPSFVYRRAGASGTAMLPKLMEWLYPRADAVIANSRGVAADLSKEFGVALDKLYTIHNPIDISNIERLSRVPVEHTWCSDGAPPFILSVGSLTLYKDFSTLVRAFAELRSRRECRLVILGEGPCRAELEDQIRQLHLENDVCMPGFVCNPFAWMRRASVFVSSSITEGCPNALMQALACDVPIVSTDSPGGAAEILHDGEWGTLVPVGDTEAMAAAIEATIDSPVRRHGRRRANDFALEEIAQQYIGALLPDHPAARSGGRSACAV